MTTTTTTPAVQPGDVLTVRVCPGMDPEQITVIHDQGRTMWCRLADGRKLSIGKSAIVAG